ncbi:MAG TPA: PaaI family thioesterase [Casimicrobium huifangae]|uniref:PaaI family thioesterase n=1 Tax=Casimicrobium huifangae TaxID=2591109 RepID=UPI0012EC0C63|nr:PaaI family thioesterase [Casimicrobium huifangae]HOB02981.1 PaaI family thioesterase [Casimicrobium huifangae]HQA35114.1 PaaI family thioesterase [Casimicrobium huifangae]HQD64925.1 PaaI family thioesterase [Casimicrobium huifangae]
MMALRPGFTVESMKSRGVGKLPGLLGIELLSVEEGLMTAELKVREELLAPNGYLHAATVVALADTMCGYGCIAHLPDGAKGFTTIELKSNHLGTALDGTIWVEARPQHLGRTTQVWDATVRHRETGKTIALFRCTQMVLWPSAS